MKITIGVQCVKHLAKDIRDFLKQEIDSCDNQDDSNSIQFFQDWDELGQSNQNDNNNEEGEDFEQSDEDTCINNVDINVENNKVILEKNLENDDVFDGLK